MSQVTKVELVSAVADKTKLGKAEVEKVMDAIHESTTTFLKAGKDVPLLGLGKVKTRSVPAKTVKTPRGQSVDLAARVAVGFSASKQLKDSLNGVVVTAATA